MQEGAGLRVVVHPRNQMPFPEDEGFNVAPGTEVFASVKKVKYEPVKRRKLVPIYRHLL